MPRTRTQIGLAAVAVSLVVFIARVMAQATSTLTVEPTTEHFVSSPASVNETVSATFTIAFTDPATNQEAIDNGIESQSFTITFGETADLGTIQSVTLTKKAGGTIVFTRAGTKEGLTLSITSAREWVITGGTDSPLINMLATEGAFGTTGEAKTITVSAKIKPKGAAAAEGTGDVDGVVVAIESLVWERLDDQNVQLDACPNNGGLRIFPDAKSQDDAEQASRRLVRLKAKITPAIAGVTVYLRVFDVDDPSANAAPIDTNDAAGIAGKDNLPTGEDSKDSMPQTTDDGFASIRVTVGLNPGNNYRGIASTSKASRDAVTQRMADRLDPLPSGVVRSEMLTVWRKLHLELDSMAGGLDQDFTNRIVAVTNGGVAPHAADGAAELNAFKREDNGRFEDGLLLLTRSGKAYDVIDNYDVAGRNDDVVTSTFIDPLDKGKRATIIDDDHPVLARKADISLMNAKYKRAYIEMEEVASASDMNIRFDATIVVDPDVILAVGRGQKDLTTSARYWVARIISCHQGKDPEEGMGLTNKTDGDPDWDYHIHGVNDRTRGDRNYILGASYPSSEPGNENKSLIFLETLRDRAQQVIERINPALVAHAFAETITVVHEVGHLFGLQHDEENNAHSLMQVGAVDPALNFDDEQIRFLREKSERISE